MASLAPPKGEKNRGFSTLKRTLDLGVEKGRLLQNSRPNVGGYTRYFSVRMPETIDITGFFKKFCIATRTSVALDPIFVGSAFFFIFYLRQVRAAVGLFLSHHSFGFAS